MEKIITVYKSAEERSFDLITKNKNLGGGYTLYSNIFFWQMEKYFLNEPKDEINKFHTNSSDTSQTCHLVLLFDDELNKLNNLNKLEKISKE